MDFDEPIQTGFTIYSKSGCHNCLKIKNLLKENKLFFIEINCDDYLVDDRDNFLSFIEMKANKYCSTFPIVFYDSKFLGGFNEASEHIKKLTLAFNELF